jgi:hypothetical protein
MANRVQWSRSVKVDIKSLSLYALPLQTFGDQKEWDDLEEMLSRELDLPEGRSAYVDWQDVDHLAELTERDKARIKKSQQKRR